MYIYIYMCVSACVCMCLCVRACVLCDCTALFAKVVPCPFSTVKAGGQRRPTELCPTKLSMVFRILGLIIAAYLHCARVNISDEEKYSLRRSYSLHGAMQVCDLDWHPVKEPGVATAHHVPPARGTGFQLRLKLDCLT